MAKIQNADPVARQRAIWLVFLGMVAGMVLLVGLGPDLDGVRAWLEQNPEYLLENVNIIVLVMAILILPIIAASIYLAWLGYLIIKFQRFPPEGLVVTRDTRIYEGGEAVNRGKIIMILSILVFIAAISIPVVIWYILNDLAVRMAA